jgi:electron transfer flavoprotein beta subunit
MKILVPIKRVPAPETRVRLRVDGGGIESDGVAFVVNPFDEIALEEALRIREENRAGSPVDAIVAVTIGDEASEEQLRTALAMGADRGIRVAIETDLDPYVLARLLRAVVEWEQPALVLMGKQAIDDDANQVGQLLAGLLGWPQATFVSRIQFLDAGARAECTRETDAGLEVIRVRLPAVVTADLRLNEPRYVSLPGIVRARGKPVATLTPADLGVEPAPRTIVHRLSPPPARPGGIRVATVEELVARLRDEARVL